MPHQDLRRSVDGESFHVQSVPVGFVFALSDTERATVGVKHPLTGQPPDYWWQPSSLDMTKRQPRWYAGHVERWNRTVSPEMSWFSTREASAMLGVGVHRVRQLIKLGRLAANGSIGAHKYIRGSDLIAFTRGATDIAPIPQHMEKAS